MTKLLLISFSLVLTLMSYECFAKATEDKKESWITVGSDVAGELTDLLDVSANFKTLSKEIVILRVPENKKLLISSYMHEKHNRCGGFIEHASLEEAEEFVNSLDFEKAAQKNFLINYTITRPKMVNSLISKTKASNIKEAIEKLSEQI